MGRQHRIEDLQGEVPGSLRPRLFRELIALELELRRARGERPGQEEYRVRFPDQAVTIGAIFAEVEDVRPWPSQLWTSDGRPDDDLCATESFEPGQHPTRTDVTTVRQLSPQHQCSCGDGRCFSDRSCHQWPDHGRTWRRGLAARSDD